MLTELLKTNIDNAVNNLIPCFKVTEEELARFKEPEIRRTTPYTNKAKPYYYSIENFFYFPLNKSYLNNLFSKAVIHHEVGHYIHFQINSFIAKVDQAVLKNGKEPHGYGDLVQLVAEYGNFILGLKHNLFIRWGSPKFGGIKEVYNKYGKDFLPQLARMSIEEAEKQDIIPLAYVF